MSDSCHLDLREWVSIPSFLLGLLTFLHFPELRTPGADGDRQGEAGQRELQPWHVCIRHLHCSFRVQSASFMSCCVVYKGSAASSVSATSSKLHWPWMCLYHTHLVLCHPEMQVLWWCLTDSTPLKCPPGDESPLNVAACALLPIALFRK